jgi:hypothetical protein
MTMSLFFALAVTLPASPDWQSDYAQALKVAATANRPLAVFIGNGPDGYKAILGDAAPARQALAEKYVCLYVDATQAANRDTVASFRASGPTLVLSDKTRAYQAFRSSGPMPAEQLVGVLNRYANYQMPVYDATIRPAYYEPPVAPTGFVPAPVQFFGGGRGGC